MSFSGSQGAEKQIEKILRRSGFEPDGEVIIKFAEYLKILKKWNRTHNLTSLTSDRDIITRHFLDSLSLARCFQELGVEWRGKNLADVGTGAGFPGCPLKIYLKDINLFLIESSYKKCAFLEYLKTAIGEEWKVICKRAEEVRDRFDIVVSRALGEFEEVCHLLEGLSERYVFVMKGRELGRKWMEDLGYKAYSVRIKGLPEYYILYKEVSPPSR